jgi:PEP-CTERM motif
MRNIVRSAFLLCAFSALCQTARGGMIYNVTLNTAPLVGHPAGPFYVELTFTDGSGIGDANNTVTLSNFNFGGGSALGGPLVFGGASGSLETGVTIVDNSFLSLFSEQFAPGLLLSFSLGLTSNDDAGGTPDGFTFFLLDSSGVPIPTLAPFGDYFIGADLGSTGPVFNVYGSDSSRPLSVGNPVSFAAPTITAVSSVPEPSTIYLLGGALLGVGVLWRRRRLPGSSVW